MVESAVLFALVNLQRRLLKTLFELHPEFESARWLVGAPLKVELRVNEEIWDVARHGAGLMFKRREPSPRLVVDVHVGVSNPSLLDAWRLQQFVESEGGTLSFDAAEAMLRRGVDSGILLRRGNAYQLGS